MNLLNSAKNTFRFNSLGLKSNSSSGPSRKVYGGLGWPGQHQGLPDLEFLSELAPPEGLERYYKMTKNDPLVGGLILHLKKIIQRMRFSISLNGSPANSFLTTYCPNLNFEGLIEEVCSAFTFGFYLGELIWQTSSNKVILSDLSPRWQPTICSMTTTQAEQQAANFYGLIPWTKCVHHIFYRENRNPYGVSLLRHLYKPYYYKVAIEASESVGLDRDLTGLPVMTAPESFDFSQADPASPDYDSTVKETLEWAVSIVSDVRRDQQQGVVKPYGWILDIIRGENRTSVPTSEIISRYNTEMAAGVLQNFLSLGAFATASNTNAEIHLANFLNACDSYAGTIAQTINRQVFAKIAEYNRLDSYPELSFAPISSEKLADLASFVGRLTSQGVISPTTKLEKELLQIASLPYDPETKKTFDSESKKFF